MPLTASLLPRLEGQRVTTWTQSFVRRIRHILARPATPVNELATIPKKSRKLRVSKILHYSTPACTLRGSEEEL